MELCVIFRANYQKIYGKTEFETIANVITNLPILPQRHTKIEIGSYIFTVDEIKIDRFKEVIVKCNIPRSYIKSNDMENLKKRIRQWAE